MKAVVFEQFGGSEVLQVADVPQPQPASSEVLIRLQATSVNPVDWKIREGYLANMIPHDFPVIPGWDAAGTIAAVGSDVQQLQMGDPVYAYTRKPRVHGGTYAEYVTVPADAVAPLPSSLTANAASAVPLVALTAWQALFNFAELHTGESVLIHAGAGGVGSFAVQFAKHRGAKVITTAGPSNHGYLKELGADHVVDYTAGEVVAAVRAVYPDGVNVVLDAAGGDALVQSWEILAPAGRLVSIVDTPDAARAERQGVKAGFVFVSPNGAQLRDIGALIDAGSVRIPHLTTRSVREAAAAQDDNRAGHTRGKVVLTIDF
jgi:NADPH2:quinone reductase